MLANAIINKYIGKPFKHQGRDDSGYDCWGLILAIYKDLGYELEDIYQDYESSRTWKDHSLYIEFYHKQWVRISEPRMYDSVLFKNSQGIVMHIGVLMHDGHFLHCSNKIGVILSRLNENKYKTHIEGFYRLKVMHDPA